MGSKCGIRPSFKVLTASENECHFNRLCTISSRCIFAFLYVHPVYSSYGGHKHQKMKRFFINHLTLLKHIYQSVINVCINVGELVRIRQCAHTKIVHAGIHEMLLIVYKVKISTCFSPTSECINARIVIYSSECVMLGNSQFMILVAY